MESSSKLTHKLTRTEAEEIREKYSEGTLQRDLAKLFGVSIAAVSAIVTNKTHVYVRLTLEERRRNKKDSRMRAEFGISLIEWEEMLERSKYSCESCGASLSEQTPHHRSGEPFLNCDHDHVTGKARGVLCSGCNLILGKAGDSVERLQGLIDYLNRKKF